MKDENIQISIAAPLDLHPAVFDAIAGLTDDTRQFTAGAAGAFQSAVEGLTAIAELRTLAASNPTLTPEARILQVSEFADRKVAGVHKKIDEADSILKRQISFTEAELQKPLEATVHSTSASEIRALARAMTRAERTKLISGAITSNDMTILSSMLAAHPLLSGLTPLERDMFTRRFRETSQPGLAQRLAVMVKAKEILNDRSGLVMKRAQELIGADRSKVAALRAAHAKFSTAMAK